MYPRTKIILQSVVVVVWLAGSAGVSAANGPARSQLASALGTGFTYQGLLKDTSGQPVTNRCDFQFTLWDSLSGGNALGTVSEALGVGVSQGYFTAQVNAGGEFGASAFTGQARWLAISVRCPAGSGGYTALTPRQNLTPAPQALALPGLYTQVVSPTVNVVGGAGNGIYTGVRGSTVAGGGSLFGCGTGGQDPCPNWITADYSFIGGGRSNTADGYYNVLGGGSGNTTSENYAVVGGGEHNEVAGAYGTIGGGTWNVTFGLTDTIGGGEHIWVEGNGATVAGGSWITATGAYAAAGGGAHNLVSGAYATVAGGRNNTASGTYATVSGGSGAVASQYGESAYASGSFVLAEPGTAQASQYILRTTTNDAITHRLYLDGITHLITLPVGSALVFNALIIGRNVSGTVMGAYDFSGYAMNTATEGMSFENSIIYSHETDLNLAAAVTIDNFSSALIFQVTGLAGEPMRWVASVRTVEVGW